MDDNGKIIAGVGIIDNDFHDRKDLSPNLCALFVEKEHRKQDIARSILDFARKEWANRGHKKLYLATDHTELYEKCGWEYFTMVNDVEETPERIYVASTLYSGNENK